MEKHIRLTAKEIARSDNGIALITRPQPSGEYLVAAVWTDTGELVGHAYQATTSLKTPLKATVREVARWLDKCGFQVAWASEARVRSRS